ncbi:MAG: hypothetical protein OXT09_05975 [Myxococcales bacterium]|nr:hypothetical protein [Myxococcales bacterium]
MDETAGAAELPEVAPAQAELPAKSGGFPVGLVIAVLVAGAAAAYFLLGR